MIKRQIEGSLTKLAKGFPVVVITGPRQSGKTTLAKALFKSHPYVSLELPVERAFAAQDPYGFLARIPDGAVLDEVQKAHNLAAFREFMTLTEACTTQEINHAKIAAACGISANTVKSWLGVLEASYIIRVLRHYFDNFSRRATKTPKLYFLDTGLACHLRKIRDPQLLADPVLKGHMFENWVVGELMKLRMNRREEDALYFWREQEGLEVDVVVDHGVRIEPIEIKGGSTPKVEFAGRLNRFGEWAGDRVIDPKVIDNGNEKLRIKGVNYIPWREYFSSKRSC